MHARSRLFYLLVSFCSISFGLIAQRTIEPKGFDFQQKGIIYNTEWSIQPAIWTNGYSIAYAFGRLEKYNLTHYKKIELGYLRHPREHSQSTIPTQLSGGLKSYTFGKINYFFPIRAMIGTKHYLSEKSKRKGVAIGYLYEGGVNIGIIKPYMLKLIRINPGTEEAYISIEEYSEENAELFLDPLRIAGNAGIFKGFDQFSIIPGLSAKLAALFAWGAYDKKVFALELGISLDMYLSEIPLIAIDQNQPYALNFYISLHLGNRK